jgi:hypothetical protein
MRQLTLVAFYGRKPDQIAGTIRSCQTLVAQRLAPCFRPYDLHQVHATVIGLESIRGSQGYNRNLAERSGLRKTMDLLGFVDFLQNTRFLPLTVQLGGFADRDYPFNSRNCRPYERSFSIQGDKAVLMGWPVTLDSSHPNENSEYIHGEPVEYPDTLEQLRRHARKFNIVHSWHRRPGDVDNDFYMRIGSFSPAPTDEKAIRYLETEVRAALGNCEPTFVPVRLADLALVSYSDESLPLASSLPWSLEQVGMPNFVSMLSDARSHNTGDDNVP